MLNDKKYVFKNLDTYNINRYVLIHESCCDKFYRMFVPGLGLKKIKNFGSFQPASIIKIVSMCSK